MATLIVLSSPCRGSRLVLPGTRQAVVGRDPTCDLVLNKRSISRFHAQLSPAHGEYYLEDMKSTNGTFLNGTKIHNRICLKHGDRIVMHDIPIMFFKSDQLTSEEEAVALESMELNLSEQEPEQDSSVIGAANLTAGAGEEIRGRLRVLLEITQALGSSLEIKEILPRILDLLFRMFPPAVHGEIYLLDRSQNLVPVALKHGRAADSTDLTGTPLNLQLINQVLQTRHGTIQTSDGSDSGLVVGDFFQSVICAPLLGQQSAPLGVILLESNDPTNILRSDDLELLTAVCLVAGQAIAYSQAHEIVVEHQNTIRQMETARQIQLGMLPRQLPEVPDFDFSHYYHPAEKVGGDYFFYEKQRDKRVIMGIADASGKGLPAALNIARFAGEVRLRIATAPSLKSALASLNQFVIEGSEECMFITACLCVLDPIARQVAITNAGHLPPLLRRAGSGAVEELVGSRRNFPLGIEPTFDAHPWIVQLNPGDQMLLFTDGLTEAMNPQGTLFGTRRLAEIISERKQPIATLIERIIQHLTEFRSNGAISDDTTIVGLECRETN